jgi:hypothetical protein
VTALRRTLYLLAVRESPLLEDAAVVFGLGRLAGLRGQWLRRIEDWQPPAGDARDQFRTLTRHLLCRYPVPSQFDEAWLGKSELANAGRRSNSAATRGSSRPVAHATASPPQPKPRSS